MNRGFKNEDIWITNKHRKMWLTSLVIKEMLIKTTTKHHFILTRLAKTNKTDKSKYE